ncbi:MAG: trigger factor [bacterium]|nr:trigger factor [bacterium]
MDNTVGVRVPPLATFSEVNDLKINTTIERPGGNTALLDIEIPVEIVTEEVTAIYRKLSKQAAIPGFRKGKIPRDVLDKHFASTILEELINTLIPRSYDSAVKEHKLRPIGEPKIEMKNMTKDGPFVYEATVDHFPEVELPDYLAIAGKQKLRKPKVTNKQVEEALAEVSERNANLVPVEDRASEKDDLVILEFIVERPAGFKEDTVGIWAGEEGGFASRQVMGHLTDDTFSLEIEYPEDFSEEDLAGTTVKAPVKVAEIKKREIPELNDEFAADLDFESLGELKAAIKKDLLLQDADTARFESFGKLIEDTLKGSSVNLSDGFLERRLCAAKGVETLDDIEEDVTPILGEARDYFTRDFVIGEIAEREGISITDEEIKSIRESQMERGGYAQSEGEIYSILLNSRLVDRFFPADEEENPKTK